MTEKDVILAMRRMKEYEAKLAYDAMAHRDYGEEGAYNVPGVGVVPKLVVDSLLTKGLIYYDEVICGGSVQTYELTELGKTVQL